MAVSDLFAPAYNGRNRDAINEWYRTHLGLSDSNSTYAGPLTRWSSPVKPPDVRERIAEQIVRGISDPMATGDTNRYPGGIEGSLTGAAPNEINAVNNSLDRGQTDPPAPSFFSGITDPSQLGPVLGQPTPSVAPAAAPTVAPDYGRSNTTVAPAQTIPNIDPKDPYDPNIDTNTPPSQVGVSKGAPQLGSRGFAGPTPLDPNAVTDPNPPGTTVSTVGPLGTAPQAPPGYVDTQPAVNATPGKGSLDAITHAIVDQQTPDQDVPEVVTDISQIGLTPAQQSVLDNNFGLSALGKGVETVNPGISTNPTIGPVSSQQANPTSLAQDLATQLGISTPASNNFGLSALGKGTSAPVSDPNAPDPNAPDISPAVGPGVMGPVGNYGMIGINDMMANAFGDQVSTAPPGATSTMGQVDPGQYGFGPNDAATPTSTGALDMTGMIGDVASYGVGPASTGFGPAENAAVSGALDAIGTGQGVSAAGPASYGAADNTGYGFGASGPVDSATGFGASADADAAAAAATGMASGLDALGMGDMGGPDGMGGMGGMGMGDAPGGPGDAPGGDAPGGDGGPDGDGSDGW